MIDFLLAVKHYYSADKVTPGKRDNISPSPRGREGVEDKGWDLGNPERDWIQEHIIY